MAQRTLAASAIAVTSARLRALHHASAPQWAAAGSTSAGRTFWKRRSVRGPKAASREAEAHPEAAHALMAASCFATCSASGAVALGSFPNMMAGHAFQSKS
eukprot:1706465-Pyramimonas_sp.AAC.3